MEDPARVIGEPLLDLGMLVGGVVVGDGMDDLAGPDRALDSVEELDELLVGVARHAAADHGAVGDVEGGEQGGGEIGRGSCRGRGEISVGAGSLKKKKRKRRGEMR